jgi:oxygen-independent coproporphyrinogen-3 oxidase
MLNDQTTPALDLGRQALLRAHAGRVPRYTSYPTAAQFTPQIGPGDYAGWLAELPPGEPVSLYAHVPFCARLCWYCACNTRAVRRAGTISSYVGLLAEEIALVGRLLPARMRSSAVHIGGGTPNMLSPADLTALFAALRRAFDIAPDAEISAEIDPSQLSAEWVQAAAAAGLSRGSVGVQDLSPEVQAAVNRLEPFTVVAWAVDLLRAAGVRSVNFDLMYGLPRQRTADVLSTLDQVLTVAPDRLALFGYAHVPWMKAHQKLIDERDLPDDAARLEQSERAAEKLMGEGYVRIGLDHYARPDDTLAVALAEGRLHRNFQGYTTDVAPTLIGFGASAIGRTPSGFVQNHSAEPLWRRAVSHGQLPTARGVAVTADDRFRGEIIEQLMCGHRADLGAIRRRHGKDPSSYEGAWSALANLERDGVIERGGEEIRLTRIGRPFVRQVCAAFDAYLAPEARRHSTAV